MHKYAYAVGAPLQMRMFGLFAYLIVLIISYWHFSGYRKEKNHHKKIKKIIIKHYFYSQETYLEY